MSEEDRERQSVTAIATPDPTPRGVLRQAMALASEYEANGEEFYALVMMAPEEHLPQMLRSAMCPSDLAMAIQRMQLEGTRVYEFVYSESSLEIAEPVED